MEMNIQIPRLNFLVLVLGLTVFVTPCMSEADEAKKPEQITISWTIPGGECKKYPPPGAYLRVVDHQGQPHTTTYEFPLKDRTGKNVGVIAKAFGRFYTMSECGIQHARLFAVNSDTRFKNPPKLIDEVRYKSDNCRQLSVLESKINLTWYEKQYLESNKSKSNEDILEFVVCATDCQKRPSVTYYRVGYVPADDNEPRGTLKIDTEEALRECPFEK
jgi:hypothetical protein